MEGHNILYFRNLWQITVKELENLCEDWENISKFDTVPENVQEEIRSTIGLATLLINQKLKQFSGLIDDSEFNTGEKEITCLDLSGFWDMVYNEVEKLQKSFNRLQECKNNEWKFVEMNLKDTLKKKVPLHITPPKKVDSSKSHALAARQRIAEIKKKMLAQQNQQKLQNFIEIKTSKEIKDDNVEKENCVWNEIESTVISATKEMKYTTNHCSKRSSVATLKVVTSANSKKNTPTIRKGRASVKDKENALPADDDYLINVKKSKESCKASAYERKEKTSKETEFIKLQCVTRSAKKKKNLLAQQNAKENL